MTAGSIARRYARALFELAGEEGALKETEAALAEVATAVSTIDAGELAPGVLSNEARHGIGEALAGPFGPETTFGKFLRLVALRDRLAELPGIHRWFVKRLDEQAGRVRAAITSTSELSESQHQAVVEVLERIALRRVVAELATDDSLLGGAIVELEGTVYDGSIRTRLARLAERMAGNGHGGGTRGS
jgi:F-type H+-transporting ATPase subunit delta